MLSETKFIGQILGTHLFRIQTVLSWYGSESLWIGKSQICFSFLCHIKLLIHQAQLCSTIFLYISIKYNPRSDYGPVCWYLTIDLFGSWFGLQNLWILLSEKNVYSIFLLLNQEGMHAWIFIFLFQFPLCNAIVSFNTHFLPPPILQKHLHDSKVQKYWLKEGQCNCFLI